MPDPTRGPAGRARLVPFLLAAASLLTLAPAALATPEQAAVPVRGGRHPGFERLVLAWPTAVTPQLRQEEGLVRLTFPARERLDLSGVAPTPDGPVLAVEAGQARDGTELLVRVRPGAEPHLSVLADHRVVLDIAGGAAPAVRRAPPASRGAPSRAPAAEYHTVAPTPTGPSTAHPVEAASPQASAAPAPAAPGPADPLRQELYRRDLMIASLLQRVERLERGASLPEQPLDQVVGGAGPGSSDPPGQEPPADAATAQPQKPAPVSTERALERVLTRTGTLLLRPGEVEIEPQAAFTSRRTDSPVFVTEPGTGTVFIADHEVRRKEVTGTLSLRAGLPFDSQLELSVPYRYVDQHNVTRSGGAAQEEDGSGNGLGDVEIGAAKTLLRQRGWLPDLVARAYWNTSTGETEDGGVPLGFGFDEIGASLTALKRQDPLAFFATFLYETTLSKNHLDPGDKYGLIAGAALAVSPETSLRAALQQDFVGKSELHGRSLGGSDQTIGILSLDAASLIGRGVLVDVGVDIGLTSDAPDYTARVSLPIRFDLPIL